MGIHFEYSTIAEHNATEKKLRDRYATSQTVAGTQKFHSVQPHDEMHLVFKAFSFDEKQMIKKVKIR